VNGVRVGVARGASKVRGAFVDSTMISSRISMRFGILTGADSQAPRSVIPPWQGTIGIVTDPSALTDPVGDTVVVAA
jgi:hypothetical protein